MPVRAALSPGVLSPTLPVPKSIPRPEYVGKPTAREGSEPWVQTPEVIEKMRIAAGSRPARWPRRERRSRLG
ncbi:methionine aminopeptidase domain protein [Mycobacterium xenopi 4042]|uniref:Methionine aminopeptidase domain protein n=1 Tax=Mycobacterium xenopi 4042 TaxID=1299334 RepID=X8E7X4_MYCXE|nr:methionine aminopeptidase domain protein [Mycobacterium xenopi 4042]